MNSSNEILNELATLSPLLAEIEKINVFSVPDGYFNTLAEVIVDSMQEPSVALNGLHKSNLAATPEGYFENLSDIILIKIKQQAALPNEGLDELPATFHGINKNVFESPEGYFENLPDIILGKAKQQSINADTELKDLSSTLYNLKDKNVFEIPEGYFENLSDAILNSIQYRTLNTEDEIKVLSPALHNIRNKNVYKIPQGYFDTLSTAVLNKVKPQPAKVVVMHKRSSFFKYASAAAIACIALLGIYKSFNKQNGNHTALTVASLDPAIETGIKMNDKQFDVALNNLSDDEIASYLDKNGNYADVPALSSSIDEKSLPDAEQYLIDDKTLDNYLNDNNLEESKK